MDKAKLEEFRTNKVALLKQVDDLKQRFAGIDPDEVRTLAQENCRLEQQQELKAGEVEKVVENRLKTANTESEKLLPPVAVA